MLATSLSVGDGGADPGYADMAWSSGISAFRARIPPPIREGYSQLFGVHLFLLGLIF